jgi:RNA polymerase sigma-70 factor, ECF subfamily
MRSHSTSRVCAAIDRAYQAGQAAHGLSVHQEYFASHVNWVVKRNLGSDAPSGAMADFIMALHATDLYLALACAQKADKAWDRFNSLYRKYINDLANFAAMNNSASELAGSVLADLFLPDHSGQSRIASYQGRSSLATWLRAIICHRAVNERERLCNNVEDLEAVHEIADEAALSKMDALLRSSRYGSVIRESLRCSCEALSERERLLLLMRYDDGLQLGQIARLFGVHQSTITRQIEAACKKLREAVVTNLLTEHKLDRAAIDECKADILENPCYSILSLIAPRPVLR